MIIVGNSNVSSFRRIGVRLNDNGQQVPTHWVGALMVEHFFGHPAGAKVLELLGAHQGVKVLSLGTHDVYAVCTALGKGDVTPLLQRMVDQFDQFLAIAAADGKLVWMVVPQPLELVDFEHLQPSDVLHISMKVNNLLASRCREYGVAVIDPFGELTGKRPEDFDSYLQRDKVHLNALGAAAYAEALAEISGTDVQLVVGEQSFEPKNELESFVALLLSDLGVPEQAGGNSSLPELGAAIVDKVHERLAARGLDCPIAGDTELVASGLLDSLDLGEIYTFAVELLDMDIDFDVDLKALSSVDKLCDFLSSRGGASADADEVPAEGPNQQDFFLSLEASQGAHGDPDALARAHRAIANMGPDLATRILRSVSTAMHGQQDRYGVVLFWLALEQAQRGDFHAARGLLDRATNRSVPGFRVSKTFAAAGLAARPVSSPRPVTRDSGPPIWQQPVDRDALVVVPNAPSGPGTATSAAA